MKKFMTLMIATQIFSSMAFATTSIEWPELPYDTRLIGGFMSWCNKSMYSQTVKHRPEELVKNQSGVIQVHNDICSCIIDNYRINNKESIFKREFSMNGTSKDVPFFKSYFDECSQISNNIQIISQGL